MIEKTLEAKKGFMVLYITWLKDWSACIDDDVLVFVDKINSQQTAQRIGRRNSKKQCLVLTN